MLKRVIAAVLVGPDGRLLVQRRRGQLDWVLPGGVVHPDQNDQDSLHLSLRKVGISFDHANRPIGFFEGRGLPEWPEVELVCYQPFGFSVRDELGFGLEYLNPEQLEAYRLTEVERLAVAHLAQERIWPLADIPVPAVA